MELGVGFSSEELGPQQIVRAAALAEEVGFSTAWVSDHFHPWIDAQGQSPFVWSVLGGIAHATENLRVGTGVTCPIMRIHPAVPALANKETQDELYKILFEITKEVEVIKKRLAKLEAGTDTPEL